LTAEKNAKLKKQEAWRKMSIMQKVQVGAGVVLQTGIIVGTFAAALWAFQDTETGMSTAGL
jgi:hypothetical protein